MKTYLILYNNDGQQKVAHITDTGSVSDTATILWDERVDGPFPEAAKASIGCLKRDGKFLIYDKSREQAWYEYVYAQELEFVRKERAQQYPTIGDQLDALYKARLGDPTALAQIDALIAAVKGNNPKPDSPDFTFWDRIKGWFA